MRVQQQLLLKRAITSPETSELEMFDERSCYYLGGVVRISRIILEATQPENRRLIFASNEKYCTQLEEEEFEMNLTKTASICQQVIRFH